MAAAAKTVLATIRTSTTGQIMSAGTAAAEGSVTIVIPGIAPAAGISIAIRFVQNARPACAASTRASSANDNSAQKGASNRTFPRYGTETNPAGAHYA